MVRWWENWMWMPSVLGLFSGDWIVTLLTSKKLQPSRRTWVCGLSMKWTLLRLLSLHEMNFKAYAKKHGNNSSMSNHWSWNSNFAAHSVETFDSILKFKFFSGENFAIILSDHSINTQPMWYEIIQHNNNRPSLWQNMHKLAALKISLK